MEMTIREATPADLGMLVKLEIDYAEETGAMVPDDFRELEYPLSSDEILRRLEGESYKIFLAEDGINPIGYATCTVFNVTISPDLSQPEGKICDLYVCERYRKQGVASALRQAALVWFGSMDCVWETLTVHEANWSKDIYRRWGFKPYSINMRKRMR